MGFASDASSSSTPLTRRELLQALGLSGGAVLSGVGIAKAQDATPESSASPELRPGVRKPGGPTVADKVFELNGDADAIFAFVRDEVRYEAYAGALRGPLGTLWGLAGNSVDQAQLLAAMLNDARITTRFVAGPLDDSGIGALNEQMRVDLDDASEHSTKVHAFPPRQSDQDQLTDEQRQQLADLSSSAESLIAVAKAQLAETIDLITTAIEERGLTLPNVEASLPERESTQHVWIQHASGADWVDMDPTFADAEPGRSYATPNAILDALPEELFHALTFKLTAEKVLAGQLENIELLAHTAKAQDLVDVPITLMHLKPESIRGLGIAIEGAIEGTVQYMPYLAVGSEDVVAPVDRVTFGTGGGLFDVIGDDSAHEGDTMAEWLEVTINSPDLSDRVVTREVFDRLGPEVRAAASFNPSQVPAAELRDLGDGGGPTFMPFVSLWSFVTAVGDLPLSFFSQDFSIDDLYATLSLAPYGFHLTRGANARLLADAGSPRVIVNRPNVTSLVFAAQDLTADGLIVEPTMDLLFESLSAVPWSTDLGPASSAQVAAGVLNHVTERLLLTSPGDAAGPGVSLDSSAGRVFEEAARQGIDLAVLGPNESIPGTVSFSPRARRLIEIALSEGHLVIVPAEPVVLDTRPVTGWWQVHPETGETRDVMENGRSTTVPYARTLLIGTRSVPHIRAMSCGAALMFIYAGAIMTIAGSLGAFGSALGGESGAAAVFGAGAAQGVGAGGAGTGAAIALGC